MGPIIIKYLYTPLTVDLFIKFMSLHPLTSYIFQDTLESFLDLILTDLLHLITQNQTKHDGIILQTLTH